MRGARQESALKRRKKDVELYKRSINTINKGESTVVIRGIDFDKKSLQSKLAIATKEVATLTDRISRVL